MVRGRVGRGTVATVLALLLAVTAGACSGDSSKGTLATTSGKTKHHDSSALSSKPHKSKKKKKAPSSDSGALGTTTTKAPPTTPAATTSTVAVAEQGPSYFSSPSGNIGCEMDADYGARCDIKTRTWAPPPRPADCPLDYGQGVTVFNGAGTFVCAGDTALGASDVLAYGSIAQHGTYRCDSEENGMTCADTQTGHGFFLSSQSYKLF